MFGGWTRLILGTVAKIDDKTFLKRGNVAEKQDPHLLLLFTNSKK